MLLPHRAAESNTSLGLALGEEGGVAGDLEEFDEATTAVAMQVGRELNERAT